MDTEKQFHKLLEKIHQLKQGNHLDLSLEEDLSVAIMNLVSLEEHFFFTASKTGKEEYFELLAETREIRKSLLSRMINHHEGETWCITKHLLAATMRLIEVGTKYYSEGKTKEAKELFSQASRLYVLFWTLRLKLIDVSHIKKISKTALNIHDNASKQAINPPWTLEDIVNKLVDCCNE